MSSELPRGIRNNNPGNMRPLANDTWRGEAQPDTGLTPDPKDEAGSYSRFIAPEWGVRAMVRDVRRKRRRGLDTVFKILSAYAPEGDGNNVQAYANSVCARIGAMLQTQIDPHDPLPPDTPAFRMAFAKAQTRVENGSGGPYGRPDYWYPDDVFTKGVELEEAP